MRICWYTFLLALSLTAAALAYTFQKVIPEVIRVSEEYSQESGGADGSAAAGDAAEAGRTAAGQAATGQAATGQAVTGQAVTGQTAAGRAVTGQAATGQAVTGQAVTGQAVTGQAVTGQTVTGAAVQAPAPVVVTAPASELKRAIPVPDPDFSGVLFIGDSRTLGLSEYGNLGNAEVFANSGMSVYQVFNDKEAMKDGSARTLEQVLSQNHFSIIYLMLGVNELGYNHKRTVEQYKTVVDRIREMQPDANLILEANLHVTGKKSAKSKIYNNKNINALNQEIKRMADHKHIFYIDANKLFDDKEGNLNDAYSSDGSHVLGKYYSVWAQWIRKGGAAS